VEDASGADGKPLQQQEGVLPAVPPSTPAGREQALRTLAEVGRYFRTAEPHSPVSLMIDRTIKWARMPFQDVLKELVEDDTALRNIDKLLGISRDAK